MREKYLLPRGITRKVRFHTFITLYIRPVCHLYLLVVLSLLCFEGTITSYWQSLSQGVLLNTFWWLSRRSPAFSAGCFSLFVRTCYPEVHFKSSKCQNYFGKKDPLACRPPKRSLTIILQNLNSHIAVHYLYSLSRQKSTFAVTFPVRNTKCKFPKLHLSYYLETTLLHCI